MGPARGELTVSLERPHEQRDVILAQPTTPVTERGWLALALRSPVEDTVGGGGGGTEGPTPHLKSGP